MSPPLTSRSGDLCRLQEEGYELQILAGHLLIGHVPYVTAQRTVTYGTLVSTLNLAGDVTIAPETHVAKFIGETPCDQHGTPLTRMIIEDTAKDLGDGLIVDYTFSSKPAEGYPDYYEKMTAYIRILAGEAHAIDPDATAKTFKVIEAEEDSVFTYMETASTRAGIVAATEKLRVHQVAIIGLGGTGSYILDLIAKTPIQEIHVFDGDVLLQHNAFRSPGAPTLEQLQDQPMKVDYWQEKYSAMRRAIVPHPERVDETNLSLIDDMSFVFIAIDHGPSRKLIIEHLEQTNTPYVDVGMGVYEADGSLGGILRTTTSTPDYPASARGRLPFADDDIDNAYKQNIQIAELNALNATLAVIKWKKLTGFYADLEHEHNSDYTIDGNHMLNEDQP